MLKLLAAIKHFFANLIRPYGLYDLELKALHYDDHVHQEMATFNILNLETDLNLPLQKVVKNHKLLARLDSVEVAVLDLLAFEERVHHNLEKGYCHCDAMDLFLAYDVVENYFYSENEKRHMLVIKSEEHEGEVCISIRELAAQSDCIAYLRSGEFSVPMSALREASLSV